MSTGKPITIESMKISKMQSSPADKSKEPPSPVDLTKASGDRHRIANNPHALLTPSETKKPSVFGGGGGGGSAFGGGGFGGYSFHRPGLKEEEKKEMSS